jgi:hypothetical protein
VSAPWQRWANDPEPPPDTSWVGWDMEGVNWPWPFRRRRRAPEPPPPAEDELMPAEPPTRVLISCRWCIWMRTVSRDEAAAHLADHVHAFHPERKEAT